MKKIFAANITVIGDSSYLLGFYSDYLQQWRQHSLSFGVQEVYHLAELYDTTFWCALCTPSLDCLPYYPVPSWPLVYNLCRSHLRRDKGKCLYIHLFFLLFPTPLGSLVPG